MSTTSLPMPEQAARPYGPVLRLAALALPLQLTWEWLHAPLYMFWQEIALPTRAAYIAHCTLGDLLIIAAAYLLTAYLTADARFYRRPGRSWLLFVLLSAGYTLISELVNVHVLGAWSYTEIMPLLPWTNVGLTPVLQWLVLPPVTLWLLARTERRTSVE